jgi:methionyl-tRNA formyltransferase
MNMKVVFFGGSKYVLPIIKILTPTLVVTTEKETDDALIQYCQKNNIPVLSVSTLNNDSVKKQLFKTKTQVAVLANFGLILPIDILTLYPKGIINVHPSLLPKYRGPTPGQSVILNGETETGVTLIKLDDKIDHGPILAQQKYTLPSQITNEKLYQELFALGAELLKKYLKRYISGSIQLKEQDHTLPTYTKMLTRKDGYLDINNPPKPELLDRMIRAYYPWPGVWTRLRLSYGGQRQIVKLLPGNKIQAEGKKPISIKDFINGYPEAKLLIEKILNTKY